jgi:hypothetical protein
MIKFICQILLIVVALGGDVAKASEVLFDQPLAAATAIARLGVGPDVSRLTKCYTGSPPTEVLQSANKVEFVNDNSFPIVLSYLVDGRAGYIAPVETHSGSVLMESFGVRDNSTLAEFMTARLMDSDQLSGWSPEGRVEVAHVAAVPSNRSAGYAKHRLLPVLMPGESCTAALTGVPREATTFGGDADWKWTVYATPLKGQRVHDAKEWRWDLVPFVAGPRVTRRLPARFPLGEYELGNHHWREDILASTLSARTARERRVRR